MYADCLYDKVIHVMQMQTETQKETEAEQQMQMEFIISQPKNKYRTNIEQI
jgi:hypothetical protein